MKLIFVYPLSTGLAKFTYFRTTYRDFLDPLYLAHTFEILFPPVSSYLPRLTAFLVNAHYLVGVCAEVDVRSLHSLCNVSLADMVLSFNIGPNSNNGPGFRPTKDQPVKVG